MSNPYLHPQPDRENPYLTAIQTKPQSLPRLTRLTDLITDPESFSAEEDESVGGYRSALPPSDLDPTSGGQPYRSALEDPPIRSVSDPATPAESSPGSNSPDLTVSSDPDVFTAKRSDPQPYRSPDVILQEQAQRHRLEQERLQQEAIRQRQIEAKRQRQAAEHQRQLRSQAQAFLQKLEKLDPLEGERLWFEDLATSYPNRLEAAIDFVQAVYGSGDASS